MGSLMDELKSLQAFKGLNKTVDRTGEARNMTIERPCICVLGTSSRHLDLLMEGGDICPGDVMVALSPDWLQMKAVEIQREKSKQVLLVKKAVTFERGGNSYLDVFQPPRRVTYFINEMPEQFDACGVDCAMNGSKSTMSLLDDRLLLRAEILMAKVSLPPCIVLHGDLSPGFKDKLAKTTELKLVERSQMEDENVSLKHDIIEFLSTFSMADKQVTIGKRISGGFQEETIRIHDPTFLERLSKVWQSLCQDDYITIEMIRSLPKSTIDNGPSQDKLFSVRARLTVCRGLDDQLIFSRISASATLLSKFHHPGSIFKDLATCLFDLGYTDPVYHERVKESMKNQAKVVMNLVVDFEKSSTDSYLGPRTDYIELVFDLMLHRGVMTPVLSDLSNQHMCLDTWGDNSDRLISPAWSMLHVMALRSHSVLLSGKKILFLLDERYIDVRIEYFKGMQKYGNKIVVFAPKDTPKARRYVDEVIEYDLTDGTNYTQHAENILSMLNQRGVKISGCISLNDSLGPIASKLRHMLELPGISLAASDAANVKYLTYSKLWSTPSARYSSKAVKVNNFVDLDMTCSRIQYPAFAKMDAAGAIGARVVNDAEDCKKYLTLMSEQIKNNERMYELINGQLSFVLTELLQGDEYIVDVGLFQGQFIAGFIRLAVPAKPPNFTCRAQAFPAQLSADKEASLLRASYQMCYDLGLHNGVFNVELMDTEEGPKLIEINARPGGHGIVLLTKKCLDEDLLMMNNLLHVGIRPTVVALPPQCLGYSLLLSLRHHSHLVGDETFRVMIESLQRRNMIIYQKIRKPNFNTLDKVMAFLGVVDEDMDKSKIVLLTLAKGLGLDTVEFPCADLLDSVSMRNGIPRSSK